MKPQSSRGHIVQRRSQVPRLIVLTFAIAGFAAFITLLSLFSPQIRALFRGLEPSNDNRTWLTRQWTQAERSPEEISALVEIMSDNGIQQVYLQIGTWHGQTGDYIELPYTQYFLGQFRALTGIPLYTWVILPPDKLADPAARQQVLDHTQAAMAQGFVGIHLQARSVPNESDDFIALLRDLRDILGPQGILSITVPPDRTPLDPDVPSSPIEAEDLTWSQDYKRRVLLNIDEMVLMAHASSLSTIEDYQPWLAYQVATYAEIIDALQIPMVYIVALPTYAAELGHDPMIESVEVAIQGIQDGMTRAGNASDEIDGVGLYPWEQTDLFELDTYWSEWVKREL
jgi:hypothetical protein